MNINSEWESKAPLVIAHRGASAYAPENTLSGFQRAVDLGADAIELDVKLTKDGIVVVLHDETLNRTTDAEGRLRDFTFDEIQKIDAGVKFSTDFAGERIPSLREVLQKLSAEILINIELTNFSTPWDDLPDKVIQLTNELDVTKRVLLSTFNPIALMKCQRKKGDIQTALLMHGREPSVVRRIFQRFLRFNYYHPHESLVVPRLVREGWKINAWTVNDEQRMRELLSFGIAGIITDIPDVAIRVRDTFLATQGG